MSSILTSPRTASGSAPKGAISSAPDDGVGVGLGEGGEVGLKVEWGVFYGNGM